MAHDSRHARLFWRNYAGGSNDERHSPKRRLIPTCRQATCRQRGKRAPPAKQGRQADEADGCALGPATAAVAPSVPTEWGDPHDGRSDAGILGLTSLAARPHGHERGAGFRLRRDARSSGGGPPRGERQATRTARVFAYKDMGVSAVSGAMGSSPARPKSAAGRGPAHPARERPAAQSRSGALDMALRNFSTTNFHSMACMSAEAGSRTISSARWSRGRLRQRSPSRPISQAPIGITRITTAVRCQMTSGMAGALIEGDFDDRRSRRRRSPAHPQRVVFDYRGTIEVYDTVWPEAVPLSLRQRAARSDRRVRPAKSSAGGSSMPGTRITCVSRWRAMGCRSSPMTESASPRSSAPTRCSWRRASVPMCWCRPASPEATRFGRSATTRATLRPSGRWPAWSWPAIRSPWRSPPHSASASSPSATGRSPTRAA